MICRMFYSIDIFTFWTQPLKRSLVISYHSTNMSAPYSPTIYHPPPLPYSAQPDTARAPNYWQPSTHCASVTHQADSGRRGGMQGAWGKSPLLPLANCQPSPTHPVRSHRSICKCPSICMGTLYLHTIDVIEDLAPSPDGGFANKERATTVKGPLVCPSRGAGRNGINVRIRVALF